MDRRIAQIWDAEFASGRYQGEPPVLFVQDIIRAATEAGLEHSTGLYIGCGNGRNYLPLVATGLDLIGLDVSAIALRQLAERSPERADRLIHGDLSALPPQATYPIVIGIQVFQHGDRATTHRLIAEAQHRVEPGGLFCLRVNAVGTDVWPDHEIVERDADGSFTVRYETGPKRGLLIHFFALEELERMFGHGFELVLSPRLASTRRVAPEPGQWSQWEAIWRTPPGSAPPALP
jgi:SAM-dependent methyltransferase